MSKPASTNQEGVSTLLTLGNTAINFFAYQLPNNAFQLKKKNYAFHWLLPHKSTNFATYPSFHPALQMLVYHIAEQAYVQINKFPPPFSGCPIL